MSLRSAEADSSTIPYVATVAVVAAGSFVGAVAVFGLPQDLTRFAAMLVLSMFAAIGRPQAVGSVQMSISGIVQLAAIPLIGPVGTAVIAAFPEGARRKQPVKRVFNVAQRVLLALAASVAYTLLGGQVLTYGAVDTWILAGQMAVAAMAGGFVNAVLLGGVLKVNSQNSLRVILVELLQQVVPTYAVYTVAAYMLAILWAPAGLSWVSIFFFLPSLLVFQWGLRQLTVEWVTRQQALDPFVAALDVRYPGAIDSSRLTVGAATAIASALRVKAALVEQIAVSAKLRNVGMLALTDKPAAIRRRDQAAASASLLGQISFLAAPIRYITGFHERVDGHGWPDGLSGDQIPLGSRILAVADAWSQAVLGGRDAEEAVLWCEEAAGTRLDTACVDALRRAHHRGQLPKIGEVAR